MTIKIGALFSRKSQIKSDPLSLRLNIIVFLCGAVVMVLELAGSRAIAPYFGSSLYAWTSLIGVILASLSIGYWWGGRLADKSSSFGKLSSILLLSSISIFITVLLKDYVLILITVFQLDLRIATTIAGIILFAIPSIALGTVSPYAAKIKLTTLQTSGQTVGSLYALSTLGSIFGTFLAGFVLLSYLGTTNIFISLCIVLLALALFSDFSIFKLIKVLVIIAAFFVLYKFTAPKLSPRTILDKDTAYQHIHIADSIDFTTGRPMRQMFLNNQLSSGMFTDTREPAYEYINFWKIAEHFVPNFKNSLAIGGAGYVFPFHYINTYKDAKITVVEIDPELYDIAKAVFNFEDNDRMAVVPVDARVYLNNSTEKFDVIYGDAFSTSRTVPFQLVSKEAVELLYSALNNNGVYILNLISAFDGKNSAVFHAEYATIASVFPYTYAFSTQDKTPQALQNIAIVGVKSDFPVNLKSDNAQYSKLLARLYTVKDTNKKPLILTDDYAPVERFALETY